MAHYNTDEYLHPKSYVSYIIAKLLNGGIGKTISGIYSKIRKYTLISGFIRASVFVITLLEKSAILLLLATVLILILPIIILAIAIYSMICIIKYAYLNRQIREWLIAGEKITVFITKERIFSNEADPMFLRQAKSEASDYTHPVIVICSDPIIAGKWYSLNLLAIKTDYFFVLKSKFLEKAGKKTTYIIL